MQLYVVRHGQSRANAFEDYSISDAQLTELGWSQAYHTGQFLESEFGLLDAKPEMFCSPFRRTLQTASVINRYLNTGIRVITPLHEFNGIRFEGFVPDVPLLTKNDIEILFPGVKELPDTITNKGWTAPTDETREEFKKRVMLMLEFFMEVSPVFEIAVAVTHGTFTREIVRALQGKETHQVQNCSITLLEVTPDAIAMIEESSVEHIPPELRS